MKVVSHTDGSGSVCEDLANDTETGAWVLDGSSGAIHAGRTDAASDGRWYVEQLDSHLTEHLPADVPLSEAVRRSVDATVEAYRRTVGTEVDPLERPLSAAAIVRVREDVIEFLLSADCSLALQRPDGTVETILGDGPRDLDGAVVQEIERLKAEEGLSHQAAKDRTREMIVENRRQLNRPGGYWALSFDQRAIDHARCSTLPVDDVSRLCLFSDGFERLVELYDAMSYETLFEHIESGDIEPAFDELRRVERADSDCTTYPRIKSQDDAALLGIEFDN